MKIQSKSYIKQQKLTGLEIAVIGMSCRFPDANNIDNFWKNLRNGQESVRSFSEKEMLQEGVDPKNFRDRNFINSGSYITGVDEFDAYFFNYSTSEAELLDPQIRLFLEAAWEAVENAGYNCDEFKNDVGIYVGVPSVNTYLTEHLNFTTKVFDYNSFLEKMYNCGAIFAVRTAYHLNLTGPAISVQSGCSSALAAMNLASQALYSGECSMALVGAVSVETRQKIGYFYNAKSMFSADGHCRAFDAKASGTIFGNGLGIVVLKRLEDALKDNDRIEAVIKGIAVNNDGATRMNFSAPSIQGQTKVITEALQVSKVHPETISYIEAHGTGTQLGDVVEILALTKAYKAFTNKKQYCAIGSVKTNIGHLGVAAGIAGFIKAVLCLKNKFIPASLNFKDENPGANFKSSPFYVNSSGKKWVKKTKLPRRAGISAFGMGGTNAHVILEEYPNRKSFPTESAGQWKILCLSAKTSHTLDEAINNLIAYCTSNMHQNVQDIIYTLQTGRVQFKHRLFVLCKSKPEAIRKLKTRDFETSVLISPLQKQKIIFILPWKNNLHDSQILESTEF